MSQTTRLSVVECTSVDALILGEERPLLADALVAFLESRPWFRGRGRALRSVQIASAERLPGQSIFFTFVRAEYLDAESELYAVPMTFMPGEPRLAAGAVVTTVQLAAQGSDTPRGTLVDAMEDPASARVILALASGGVALQGGFAASVLGDAAPSPDEAETEPRKLGNEREHTTLGYGTRFVLKLARRLEEGVSPEVEVGRLLAGRPSTVTPPLLAYLDLRPRRAEPMTVAVVHGFVPNVGTAWDFALKELGRYYERVLARGPGETAPTPPKGSPLLISDREPPPEVAAMIGSHREMIAQLGARLAELHLALISSPDDPAFAPEPYTALHLRSKYQSLRNLSGHVLRAVRERMPSLSPRAQAEASAILLRGKEIVSAFEPLLRASTTSARIRGHGNLHLGHALFTGKDFVLTDLNDFQSLPLPERRRKRSPLRDLAWIVQSLELAAFRALLDPATVRESDVEMARPWALHWASWTSAAVLRSYIDATSRSPVLAVDRDKSTVLFEAFRFERALYQLKATLDEGTSDVTITLLELARLL